MTTTVAVLGTGRMGAPMAARMLGAGLRVRAWNRSASRAAPLAEAGASIHRTAGDAVAGADVIVTMLADGPAVAEVLLGEERALASAEPGAVWAQMSTVGLEWTERLAAAAADRALTFVDAPVSGSEQPARDGQLVVFAAGPEHARPAATPVFDAVGRTTLWFDRVGDATRMKLVVNNWLVALVEAAAESLSYARGLGLDPAAVVDFLDGAPVGSPYAVLKGRAMLAGDFAPRFGLHLGVKDTTLALEAAREASVDLPLTVAVLERWQAAERRGHGQEDIASVFTVA